MIIKTIVPKEGDIKTYINKPVVDRVTESDPFKAKAIGVITGAVEVEKGYELTMEIFGKPNLEFYGNNEVISYSIKGKKKEA